MEVNVAKMLVHDAMTFVYAFFYIFTVIGIYRHSEYKTLDFVMVTGSLVFMLIVAAMARDIIEKERS